MTYTPADLDSAIEKLGRLDMSDAETEAVAFALRNVPEVEGFARQPQRPGEGFLLEVAGLLGGSFPVRPSGGISESTDMSKSDLKTNEGHDGWPPTK